MHSKLDELRNQGFFINISCFALSHINYINKTHYPDNPEYDKSAPFTVEAIIRNDEVGTRYNEDILGRRVFEARDGSLEGAVDKIYQQVQEAKA